MPELTSQDKESYQKLYSAAQDLRDEINALPADDALKALTSAFFNKLLAPAALSSFDQLQAQVELTGGYLTMCQVFTETINDGGQKDVIVDAIQKLLIQYKQLKVSLDAIDDDFLDDVTTPCADPLFLGFLQDSDTAKVKSWTQQLLNDQAPVLNDSQVQTLVDAWDTAVINFVEDARDNDDQLDPGQAKTIAHFFCIHDQLEELYSELSTAVALNS